MRKKPSYLVIFFALTDMDHNRTNQCNPNHLKSGPGRPAGYHGDASKAALDNHSNQLNPNNPLYRGGNKGSGGQVYIQTSGQEENQAGGCQIL